MNKGKNKVVKFTKLFKPFILLLILAIVIFSFKCCALATTAEECEEKITTNSNQINHLEETKKQLHTTAQLLRQEKTPDKELIDSLSAKWHDCNYNIQKLHSENAKLKSIITKLNQPIFIGYFTISHYDTCYKCTGKSPGDKGYGITASGTRATPNRTVAVDPKVIPIGSEVIVGEKSYIAEDTGGAIKGNKIDICVASHSEGMQKGRVYNVPVYIVKK